MASKILGGTSNTAMSSSSGEQRVPMTPTKAGSAWSTATADARDGQTPTDSKMPVPTQTFDFRDGPTGSHPNPIEARNQVGTLKPGAGNHKAKMV